MKKMLTALLLALALVAAPIAFADEPPAGVQANQVGNVVHFSVYNNSSSTVCMFPYVQEQTNVYGSVVPMIQVGPGESNVNIGAYGQANSEQAWSVRVGSKYQVGTCA
jgi:hypothetical protein